MIEVVVSVAAALIGYVCFYTFLKDRADQNISRETIAGLSVIVYALLAGLMVLLGRFVGEFGLLVYALAIVHSGVYVGWCLWRLTKKRRAVHAGAMLALAAYLLALAYVTFFMRERGSQETVLLDVFGWLKPAGRGSQTTPLRDFLLNVAMLIPAGLLVTLGIEGSSRWEATAFAVLLTTVIETCQLVFHAGTFDVSDIIANSAGGLLGAVAGAAIRRRVRQTKM